jgi:hypothetical protein
MSFRTAWSMMSVLGVLFAAEAARADCNTGADYRVTIAANTVTICPMSTTRQCGSNIDFLRQDKADASSVVIDSCASSASSSPSCYVDECVPAGSYRYGYATPYDCTEAGCGVVGLFAEVTVATPLSADCTRAASNGPPAAATVAVPWSTSSSRFKTCDSGGGCAAAASPRKGVRILDAVAFVFGLLLMGLHAARGRKAALRSG